MASRLTIIVVLALALGTNTVHAQDCKIGVYADPLGRETIFNLCPDRILTIYVVIHVEDLVSAAAFSLEIPGLGLDLVPVGPPRYGPNGNGLNIPTNGGYNVGLGECASGFQGFPVVVAEFDVALVSPWQAPVRSITLHPNPDADPDNPLYSSCSGQVRQCEVVASLIVETCSVSTGGLSWGSVKALYEADDQ